MTRIRYVLQAPEKINMDEFRWMQEQLHVLLNDPLGGPQDLRDLVTTHGWKLVDMRRVPSTEPNARRTRRPYRPALLR